MTNETHNDDKVVIDNMTIKYVTTVELYRAPRLNPPTQPGWYYGRSVVHEDIRPMYVALEDGVLFAREAGDMVPQLPLPASEYQWFGPVPTVTEVT